MERTFQLTGTGMNQNFVDDSPRQAKPVASSTLMVSKMDFDFKDFDNSINSPKATSGLSACSTTSSLGVLDLEKHSLLPDLESSRERSRAFVQEQIAISRNRFRERIGLDGTSMNKLSFNGKSFSESNSLPVPLVKPEATNTDVINFENCPQSRSITPALSVSSISSSGTPQSESPLSDKEFSRDRSRAFVQEQIALSRTRFREHVGLNADDCRGLPSQKSESVQETKPGDLRSNDSRRTFSTNPNLDGPGIFENFTNAMSPSSETGSFVSGNQAMVRLEADQNENRKQFDSLPVSPINISWNSENIEEREKQFSQIVSSRSYSPEKIPDVLRNRLNLDFKKKIAPLEKEVESNIRTFDSNQSLFNSNPARQTSAQVETRIPLHKTEFNFDDLRLNRDVQVAIADSTSFNNTLEDSRASSVASIHQITEALRRKSLISEPRRAIEHLLSVGTKSKYTPSLASVMDVKSDEDTLNATQITEHNRTPISSQCTVETPSTITCPARDFKVDAVTKKVYGCTENRPSFMTARQLLESKCFARTVHPEVPKHFHLCRGSSPLDNVTQQSDARTFWKINPIDLEDHVVARRTSEQMDNYRRKVDELSRESFSKSNIIPNHSKENLTTEPVRRISMNHNVSNALNSVYVDRIDTDALDAGVLCVGTQVEVIIAIENPSYMPVRYKMFLKSIFADKKLNSSAATIMLVSQQRDIVLLPKTESEIKVLLSPLVEGKIEVILESVCEQPDFSNMIHHIRAIGELPKLKILEPEKSLINFDQLGEGDSKMLPFRLMNEGAARIPLKLNIYEDNRSRMSCSRTIVEPSEIFHCYVRATSVALDASSDLLHLQGELVVVLDTSEDEALADIVQLQTVQLEAVVAKVNLLVDCKSPQIIVCNPTSKCAHCFIRVKNMSSVVASVTSKIFGAHKSEFNVDPKTFSLSPNCEQSINVTFSPTLKERRREVSILFSVEGLSSSVSCSVIGIFEVGDIPTSLSTPPMKKRVSAACNSPTSSSSSIGADGPMELDCTHNSVSWGSVPLHSKSIQTITLRNRNCQKEKLLLSISDSNGAFKFVENESFCRELKLVLEPKESRKFSILFSPFVADQAVNGRILITRQHSLESSLSELRKLVIPLYGIGGKVKITYSGVFHDNENRLWITPDSDAFEVKFTVENGGDSIAFLKIISDDPDDYVLPDELILFPRESSEICYTLRLSRDRLDLICKQNRQKEVLLTNRLTVLSGSESTRLRIKKLWTKYEKFENIQRIRDKVEVLVNMGTQGPVQVDTLGDNQSTLNKLWYEGVTEESIGVLISHQHLESVCLDSTVIFKDLKDETISH